MELFLRPYILLSRAQGRVYVSCDCVLSDVPCVRLDMLPCFNVRSKTEYVQGHNNIFIYCNWVVTRWQWLFYM